IPSPRRPDHSNHRLTAGANVDVFHRDLLLAFAAMAVYRVEQHRIGAGEFVGLTQVLTPTLESLLAKHRAPVGLHGGIVCGDELGRDHPFDFVLWLDAGERRNSRAVLTIALFLVGILDPE